MKPISLLVADDEALVRRHIAAVIERESLPVAAVFFAENGLEAVRLALLERPDLVIMDIQMPEADGLAALRLAARNDPALRAAVIAAEEGRAADADFQTAFPLITLPKPVGALEIKALIQGTAARPAPKPRLGKSAELTRSVLEIIEQRLSDPSLSLTVLAEHFSASPQYLSRIFSETAGQTIRACLQRRRLARAAALLGGSRRPVAEIARQCGFGNQRYFATRFKAHTGHSPLDYRKLCPAPAISRLSPAGGLIMMAEAPAFNGRQCKERP